MGIDRDTLAQLAHLFRPLRTRIANMISRGVVSLVNDGKKLQLLQAGALAGETIDDVEHHQPYGFFSVPLEGAELILVFPNGDRSHPIALAASDRRHRPVGGQGGESGLYTDEGDVIRLGRGHIISLTTSGEVRLGSDAAAEAAIKGTSRNTAEQTFLTAMNAFAAAVSTFAGLCTGPSPAALLTLTTAIAAFETAIGAFKTAAAGALSDKVKLE